MCNGLGLAALASHIWLAAYVASRRSVENFCSICGKAVEKAVENFRLSRPHFPESRKRTISTSLSYQITSRFNGWLSLKNFGIRTTSLWVINGKPSSLSLICSFGAYLGQPCLSKRAQNAFMGQIGFLIAGNFWLIHFLRTLNQFFTMFLRCCLCYMWWLGKGGPQYEA